MKGNKNGTLIRALEPFYVVGLHLTFGLHEHSVHHVFAVQVPRIHTRASTLIEVGHLAHAADLLAVSFIPIVGHFSSSRNLNLLMPTPACLRFHWHSVIADTLRRLQISSAGNPTSSLFMFLTISIAYL